MRVPNIIVRHLQDSNDSFCDSLQACSSVQCSLLWWMGRMFSLQTCIISKLLSTSFLLILNPYMASSYVHAYCVDTAGRYSRKPANPLQSMRPFAMYLHAARCIDLETWTAQISFLSSETLFLGSYGTTKRLFN